MKYLDDKRCGHMISPYVYIKSYEECEKLVTELVQQGIAACRFELTNIISNYMIIGYRLGRLHGRKEALRLQALKDLAKDGQDSDMGY